MLTLWGHDMTLLWSQSDCHLTLGLKGPTDNMQPSNFEPVESMKEVNLMGEEKSMKFKMNLKLM